MFKSKWFWILIVVLAIIATVFVVQNFPKVMSFINLDIKMSRQEAFDKAEKIVEEYGWQTSGHEKVAYFSSDYFTQIYTELKAGGKERFNQMLKDNKYSPYTWQVRFYKEGSIYESRIYFTPQGEKYGYQYKIPEDKFLPEVSQQQAISLAEKEAEKWGVDLEKFERVEERKNTTPVDRTDHTFVYERNDVELNKAKFRLTIKVAGNAVTSVKKSVKIPQTFYMDFQEMRSANNTIASTASIFMAVLYGFCGIFLGGLYLIKNKWLLWKKALGLGVFISGLEFFAFFNDLPLSWIYYDTAKSQSSFILQQVIGGISQFMMNAIMLTLTFIVAESLTRKAFPDQVRFWDSWKKGIGGTRTLIGNTVGAYLTIAFELLFVLSFYMLTTNYFGWWNPASLSTNPNIVATLFPWLPAIAQALHAGFWEEALFRAVPLAGAVLIGRKFKKERLFLVIGLVVQALIFAAGHANYAAQPAYARVVELIIPSMVFAFLYLRFGLLTASLMHFAFDAVLMSMGIWITDSSIMIVNRVLFVTVFSIPILVVLLRWWQAKRLVDIDKSALNGSWQPKEINTEKEVETEQVPKSVSEKFKRIIIGSGILFLIITALFIDFKDNQIPLKIRKSEAIKIAEETLQKEGIELDENWKATVDSKDKLNRYVPFQKIIFRKIGEDVYRKYIGDYFSGAEYTVKFRRFSGTTEERSEEFHVIIYGDGKIRRYQQIVPEDKELINIEEGEAKQRALHKIKEFYNVDSSDLELNSINPIAKPNRKDWSFVFRLKAVDEEDYDLRYSALVSGGKVRMVNRYFFIPEKIKRDFENENSLLPTIKSFAGMAEYALFLIGLIMAIFVLAKKKFDKKMLISSALVIVGLFIIAFLNKLPVAIAGFNTSEPLSNQYLRLTLTGLMKNILIPIFIAIFLQLFRANNRNESKNNVILNYALGFIISGVYLLLAKIAPNLTPAEPKTLAAVTFLPSVQMTVQSIVGFTAIFIEVSVLTIIINKLTNYWQKQKFIAVLIVFVVSLMSFIRPILDATDVMIIVRLCVTSIALTSIYIATYANYLKLSLQPIAQILTIPMLIVIINHLLDNRYPGAIMANIGAVLGVILISVYYNRIISKN